MKNLDIYGMEVKLENLKNAGPIFWGWVSALVIVILVGLYFWALQLPFFQGLIVTNMRDVFSWGFYIQNFMYFVGLAAGGLVVYSSVSLFNAKDFAPVSRIAVLQAGICVVLAFLFIMVDMGHPERGFWFALTPNIKSVLFYDAMIINVYIALCAVDAWVLMSGRATPKVELGLTLVSLPAAIGMHSITAWALGLQKAREGWHTAIMAPIFVSSAVVSGIALLMLIAMAVDRFTEVKFKKVMFDKLAKLAATVIPIDIFLLASEVLQSSWPSSTTPGHWGRISLLLFGKYSGFFMFEIFLGGVLPFFLLAIPKTRVKRSVQILACSLILIGVFIKRFMFIVMGFAVSPLGPIKAAYAPSLVEIFVTLALWAMGILMFTFAVKVLPIENTEEGH
jgi:molybdopterin-containing oxidoreductase family membrane subunit